MYNLHTNILNHEHICLYIFMFKYLYIFMFSTSCIYLCSSTYMYIHLHDFMKQSEHVHTCLYHVQTRMYRFAQSCPGGQDSRWRDCASAARWPASAAAFLASNLASFVSIRKVTCLCSAAAALICSWRSCCSESTVTGGSEGRVRIAGLLRVAASGTLRYYDIIVFLWYHSISLSYHSIS